MPTATKALRWYDDGFGGQWPDCDACLARLREPGLRASCASVGIEHGKSTVDVLADYLDLFHRRGHTQ
ncbi:MAG TPA: hypothetical protein VGB14_00450 [Acidimicrobiales bacterium]|jgi:hypothetical protein